MVVNESLVTLDGSGESVGVVLVLLVQLVAACYWAAP